MTYTQCVWLAVSLTGAALISSPLALAMDFGESPRVYFAHALQLVQSPSDRRPREAQRADTPREESDDDGGYEGDDAYRPRDTPRLDDAYRPPARRPDRDSEDAHDGTPEDEVDESQSAPLREDTYSENEILDAGKKFFGTVNKGLARVVTHAFREQGRPNGYILGEDAGGAFVAGLRYGQGRLYTKEGGEYLVYWQGPSVGYDFGGEGSKTVVLVYNLQDPEDIYRRFAGIQGSAYFVAGVNIEFQKNGRVVLAPIRSGIGLRLGANIGYLKYTRTPTANPF